MSHTQMFRYWFGFHGALPKGADFMALVWVSGSNQVAVVCVRVIPVVAAPVGSTWARQNWKPTLPMLFTNGLRTPLRSVLFCE